MIRDWFSFWDSPHFIYVSARHKDVYCRPIAKEIAALVPGPQARVLDYGSGEAPHADIVAAAAGELFCAKQRQTFGSRCNSDLPIMQKFA